MKIIAFGLPVVTLIVLAGALLQGGSGERATFRPGDPGTFYLTVNFRGESSGVTRSRAEAEREFYRHVAELNWFIGSEADEAHKLPGLILLPLGSLPVAESWQITTTDSGLCGDLRAVFESIDYVQSVRCSAADGGRLF